MNRIIMLILLTAVVATAQIKDKLTFRLYGGATLPQESSVGQNLELVQFGDLLNAGQSTSNFEDYWNRGWNLGVGFDYQVFENFSAGVEFGANFFTVNETQFENDLKEVFAFFDLPYNSAAGEITQGSTEIYTLLLSVKASYPLGSITPYVSLNGGTMFINQKALKITYFDQPGGPNESTIFFYDELPGQNGTVLTANVGIGLQYGFLPTVSSFAEFNYTLGHNTSYDNVDASTIIFPVRVGLVFRFSD
jgi:opacity protein-like surface antigen